MMKKLLQRIALPLMGLSIMLAPATAAAWDPFGGVDCSKAGDSAVCARDHPSNPIAGPDGVIVKVTNIVAIVAGIAAVILIFIGGLRYITSGGDANNTKSAKNTILYALIGLAVIAAAKILITFIVSKI